MQKKARATDDRNQAYTRASGGISTAGDLGSRNLSNRSQHDEAVVQAELVIRRNGEDRFPATQRRETERVRDWAQLFHPQIQSSSSYSPLHILMRV